MFKYTSQIVDLVWGEAALMGQAVCIAGHTGCGKSTGLPVVLMRELRRQDKQGRIVVTQPRRLAATKLAQRVAATLGEPLGESVAYAIGQDVSEGYESSSILFVTTGWLREKLLHDPSFLTDFSHVIMDEAHERTVDLDMLALLIKRNRRSLEPVSPAVSPTVVVMSATMEAGVFAKYFGGEVAMGHVPEPLTVGGRRYPVMELTLDDLIILDSGNVAKAAALGLASMLQCPRVILEALAAVCGAAAVGLLKGMGPRKAAVSAVAAAALQVFTKFLQAPRELPKPEITDHLANLGAQLAIRAGTSGAAVLVFVPGMHEIGQLRSALQARAQELGVEDSMHLCILHSVVPPEEQDEAMELPPLGCFKVVLATNIAESSITIPDVTVVIDYCLQRVSSYDTVREAEVLQLEWTSLASQKQRAGRAGRVAPGVVVRMVSSRCREAHQEYDLPAILRESLAGTVLSLESRMRQLGKAADLLQEAPQPPVPEKVVYALEFLYKTGALRAHDDSITALGRLAARLPTSVSLSRLIHLGLASGCCELAAVVVAAGMGLRTEPFSRPKRQLSTAKVYVTDMRQVQSDRERFEDGGYCEPLMLIRCFQEWMQSPKTSKWAKTHGVNIRRMKEFEAGVVELCLRLDGAMDHAGLIVRDECRRQLHALSMVESSQAGRRETQARGGRAPAAPKPSSSQRLLLTALRDLRKDMVVMWCLCGLAFAPNMAVGIPQRGNHSWENSLRGSCLDATRTVRLRGGKKDPLLPSQLQDEATLQRTIEHMTGPGTVTGCRVIGGGYALVEFKANANRAAEDDDRCPHLPRNDLPRAAKLMLATGDAWIQGKDEYTARIRLFDEDGAESIIQRADWKLPIAWHRVTAGGQGAPQRVMPDVRGPLAAMGGDACGECGDLVAVTHQLTALGKSKNENLHAAYTTLLPRQGGLSSMLLLASLPLTRQQHLAPRLLIETAEGAEPRAVRLLHDNGLAVRLYPLDETALRAAETIQGAFIDTLVNGTVGNLGPDLRAALEVAARPGPAGFQPSRTGSSVPNAGHSAQTSAVPIEWRHDTSLPLGKPDPIAPIVLANAIQEVKQQAADEKAAAEAEARQRSIAERSAAKAARKAAAEAAKKAAAEAAARQQTGYEKVATARRECMQTSTPSSSTNGSAANKTENRNCSLM